MKECDIFLSEKDVNLKRGKMLINNKEKLEMIQEQGETIGNMKDENNFKHTIQVTINNS